MNRSKPDKTSESDSPFSPGRLALVVSTLVGAAVLGLRWCAKACRPAASSQPAPSGSKPAPSRSKSTKGKTKPNGSDPSMVSSVPPVADVDTSLKVKPTDKVSKAKASSSKGSAKASKSESSSSSGDAWDLDGVLERLDRHRQRATYGAVAGLVGRLPINVMRGRDKVQAHSWVVNQKTGEPTNYPADALHPELKKHDAVIDDTDELRDWLAGRD